MSLVRPRAWDDRGREVMVDAAPSRRLRLPWIRDRGDRVCDACGYDLNRLPQAADKCTVCPECGAAWDLRPASPELRRLVGFFRRWRRRAALATKRCPACKADLAGLKPEADGCTVCPECGAAWKLEEGTKARRHEGTEGGIR